MPRAGTVATWSWASTTFSAAFRAARPVVENIIIIYSDGSEFSCQFSIVYFLPPNIDTPPT
jgi:hypothetical protein